MIRTHITIPDEVDEIIRKYIETNHIKYSQGVVQLIMQAIDNIEIKKKLDLNNSLLDKIYSRSLYTKELIEQFYSDMEIEKLTNPKNNKALQKFMLDKYKDKMND